MVACTLSVAPVAPVAQVDHPWISPENLATLQILLEGGSIHLPFLQQYLWNGISPIGLGLHQTAFGRYLLYILWLPFFSEEECARLCRDLHYMAIFVILKKYAYTGLMPCGIYNLIADEWRDRIPTSVRSIRHNFTFPEKTVSVELKTSYLQALLPGRDSMGRSNGPRGCILILAYKYGDEFGVYQFGGKTSGGYIDKMWDVLTDVNPLETAFCAKRDAGQVLSYMITDELDGFRDL